MKLIKKKILGLIACFSTGLKLGIFKDGKVHSLKIKLDQLLSWSYFQTDKQSSFCTIISTTKPRTEPGFLIYNK